MRYGPREPTSPETDGARRVNVPVAIWLAGIAVSSPAEGGGVELTGRGLPRITLLSPTPDRLRDLYKVWDKELERLRRMEREGPEPEPAALRGMTPDLQALAARVTPADRGVANGSSIAMLIEQIEDFAADINRHISLRLESIGAKMRRNDHIVERP